MKYVDNGVLAEVRFGFTTQNTSGLAAFTGATKPVILRSNQAVPVTLESTDDFTGSVVDLTADIAGASTGFYEVVINTSGLTADVQYDAFVVGTIDGNTWGAKVGEFQVTPLTDLTQIELLDVRVWTGTLVSGTSTTQFVCTMVDGNNNSLTTGAVGAKALTANEQLKNRALTFNGDQTAALRGQVSRVNSWTDSATDQITVTLDTSRPLSTTPAANDTFILTVF